MPRTYWIIAISLGAVVVAVAITLLVIWFPASSPGWLLARRAGSAVDQRFTVRSGETISVIADNLKAAGLIRSAWGFKLYLKLSGKVIVQPGLYQLSPAYPLPRVANIIASGSTANVTVTIPEGYTLAQIIDTLVAKEVAVATEFTAALKDFAPDYEFFKSKPADKSLEGFMFPDTYRLIKGEPTEAIRMMLDNFGVKYKDEIKPRLGDKNLYEVMIIASLVEKEAKTQTDREQITAVLYNRLEAGMRLDVDATVRYAINDWKKALTKEDLSIDSPYNTRRVSGLPPTPICNPGLAAIKAALNPPDSDYYYYLTDYDGITHYAKTLKEHTDNKLKYL
ncbi:hypothetical protein A2810_01860 [candidate division Kazan bacterium RIFCSPHIGHO2_01_FULL_49_10]|uniref:Endolytic murein transglycosylase n=1 Tax=candidate division Kazan bacterium RIFCSPLOWO2_01_FULL_48_13 TaxID=1798539 RepID=A0A1F4PN15_UNCK3|nr:MAG: hypothetical protein A2810_01860 [candidate division Kazan bacterium RIFCSPHIGHO2_01_FULL_49_10]OGB85077.1 MAG: hypothetical protein A2994_00510 [candidate division Kazan bacterium RIFCSPLOWO2_01_FULL_48_13]